MTDTNPHGIPPYNPPPEEEEVDPGRDALLPPAFPSSSENDPNFSVTIPVPGATNDPADRGNSGYAPGQIPTVQQDPRYFDGDQSLIWIAGQPVSPSTLSPETIAGLQAQYEQAGLLAEGSYTPGFWDEASVSANRNLLEEANISGLTARDVLGRRLQSAADFASPSSGGGRSLPPTVRISNSDDLRSVFRQVARQQTGGVFAEDDQIEAMVTAFQNQERSFQQAAMSGGEVESAPSAQTFAENELESLDPGSAQANRFQQMTQVLNQIVGA